MSSSFMVRYTLKSRIVLVEVELNGTFGGSILKSYKQRFVLYVFFVRLTRNKKTMLLFPINKNPPLSIKWPNVSYHNTKIQIGVTLLCFLYYLHVYNKSLTSLNFLFVIGLTMFQDFHYKALYDAIESKIVVRPQ